MILGGLTDVTRELINHENDANPALVINRQIKLMEIHHASMQIPNIVFPLNPPKTDKNRAVQYFLRLLSFACYGDFSDDCKQGVNIGKMHVDI